MPILRVLKSPLLVGLLCLLVHTRAYGVDCSTTFDQSCLSGDFDLGQVETDHNRKVEIKKQEQAERVEAERLLAEAMKEAVKERRQDAMLRATQNNASATRDNAYEMRRNSEALEEANRRSPVVVVTPR